VCAVLTNTTLNYVIMHNLQQLILILFFWSYNQDMDTFLAIYVPYDWKIVFWKLKPIVFII